ncbi:sulfotransferase [uncultured Tateyamaria sp.]|uniref:sulfotransferase family protein n=1 Tax=uncultured Tateyamaria sp. TaxID=455651 RepID=UPI002609A653|nr:sulfotransferase [uncultured Tateyamaria sp.]
MADLINFVVAGAQKSGTTALRFFLSQHPEIGLVRGGGETHFFNRHVDAAQRSDYTEYHAMYTDQALAACTGDVTPYYLYGEPCIPSIQRYNPDMKIIVLLRNPILRAYSQWIMEREMGRETRSFMVALLHEARYFSTHGQHPVFSYVQRGFYDAQIARLYKHFPRENCFILRTSDLWQNHSTVMSQIFKFLGVSDQLHIQRQRKHTRNYSPMPDVSRRLLYCVFCNDIARLENRLQWDLSSWR